MLGLIHAGVIDCEKGAVIPEVTVLIDGNRIAAVEREMIPPEGCQIIDLSGMYLLPGFSDAHTHLGGSARTDRPPHTGSFLSYDYAQHREEALDWGITALRSAGDFMPDILQVRRMAEEGRLISPHILTAGKMLQARGGHPGYTVLFGNEEVLLHEITEVDDETDIEGKVQALADAGVDWIKLHISDMDIFNYPHKKTRLTNEQIHRIITAAHGAGKPVMAHVDDLNGMMDAALVGVDSIEHTLNAGASEGLEMTEELLKLLVERQIWVVPTLVATRYHDGKAPGTTEIYGKLKEAVGRMIAAGVALGVGCDSGIPFLPFGKCVHEEMALLREAGLTPAQVLYAATMGNARLFRKDREYGSLKPQKAADLVVLGSNPLEDIRHTEDIRMVILGGAIVRDRMMSR